MHRLTVALLSALDALIQVAVGLAVIAAPLTAVWVFSFGPGADWSALWPTTAAVWQVGNLVPLQITLPDALIAAGISPDAAQFTFSLAPMAFAGFTVIFGLRSGGRAARSGAWITGATTALCAAGALAALIALTSVTDIVSAPLWQAILVPAVLYGAAVLLGGVVSAWRHGDDGVVDAVRDALEPRGIDTTVGAIVVGAVVSLTALVGAGSLALAAGILVSGGEIVALYQAANVDFLGALIVTLGQLAYLPTLVVWAIAWVAGPGFAVGAGSTVSPVGTDLAVVPSIPIFGLLPESSQAWVLLVALLPVAAGALGGWFARSHLHSASEGADATAPRVWTTLGMAVGCALAAAALAAAASGAMGPGRLGAVGPHPGPVALAVGVEVMIGAAILLLSPLSRARKAPGPRSPEPRPDLPHTHPMDEHATIPIPPNAQQ